MPRDLPFPPSRTPQHGTAPGVAGWAGLVEVLTQRNPGKRYVVTGGPPAVDPVPSPVDLPPPRAYDPPMAPDRKKLVDRYRAGKRDMEARGLLLSDDEGTDRVVAREVEHVREEMWQEKNAE
jgi:hypothetical protein